MGIVLGGFTINLGDLSNDSSTPIVIPENGATIIATTNLISGMSAATFTRDGGNIEDHLLAHATSSIQFNTDGSETYADLHNETGTNNTANVSVLFLGENSVQSIAPSQVIPAGYYTARRVGPSLSIKQISSPSEGSWQIVTSCLLYTSDAADE